MTLFNERRRPTIYCFLGYPGFGKSTQAKAMAEALGIPRLRLGQSMVERGYSQARSNDQRDPREWFTHLHAFTQTFLDEVVLESMNRDRQALLDGFPRSEQEAKALVAFARKHQFRITVLHFTISDPKLRHTFSIERQRSRAVKLGQAPDDERYLGKTELAERFEQLVIDICHEADAHVIKIDPRRSLEVVCEEVRRTLRVTFKDLPWNKTILETLRTHVPGAYLIGEYFFTPFFQGVRGPHHHPLVAQVALADRMQSPARVQEQLAQATNAVTWIVSDVVAETRKRTGILVETTEEALQIPHHLIGLSGGVRLRCRANGQDRLEVVMPPDSEAHLRRGLLQPSMHADLRRAADYAKELVRRYPGLDAPFIKHQPREILPDWHSIHTATTAMEKGGRRLWGTLDEREERLATELRAQLKGADKRPAPVPFLLRTHPLRTESPWKQEASAFREWLMSDHRHDDPFLFTVLKALEAAPQKPTHQGWMTDQHTLATLYCLTDIPEDKRIVVRVAALFHDLGKLENVNTPGAHAAIGAKLWKQYRPSFVEEAEIPLISFLIEHHDIFGRLARGVKEPQYTGGIDPASIRAILERAPLPPQEAADLLFTLNYADIASVPALRWTLPELDIAYEIVIGTHR